MPKRDDHLLLLDMIECCKSIFAYTNNLRFDDYLDSKLIQDAVTRNFGILGEAAKMMSEEVRINHPEIEWRKMGDFRNILIHDYFGINHELLWQIKENFLPETLDYLEQIIEATEF